MEVIVNVIDPEPQNVATADRRIRIASLAAHGYQELLELEERLSAVLRVRRLRRADLRRQFDHVSNTSSDPQKIGLLVNSTRWRCISLHSAS